MGQNFINVLSQQGMWGGVLATMVFIVLGYFVTRNGIFNTGINSKLSKFVVEYSLPFICITAFMQPADINLAKQIGIVLAAGIVFYVLSGIASVLIVKYSPNLVPKLVSKKATQLYEASPENKPQNKMLFKDQAMDDIRAKVLTSMIMLTYGSIQVFAYPLVIAMSGDGISSIFTKDALALAQIWVIPFTIGAFSFAQLQYSGQKFSRRNLKPITKSLINPSMVMLYISLTLWAIQFAVPAKFALYNQVPYTNIKDIPLTSENQEVINSGLQFWAGLRTNLPVLDKILTSGVVIFSPISWLVIGGTLAASNLKRAIRDKIVWLTTGLKLILMPIIMFLIALMLFGAKLISVSTATLLVLFGTTPPATINVIYSVAYNHKNQIYTAEVSSLGTLMCIIAMPVWIVLSNSIFKAIFS